MRSSNDQAQSKHSGRSIDSRTAVLIKWEKMKRTSAAIYGSILLIIFAHRLPAPISEEQPSPIGEQSKPKSAPARHRSSDSSDSSSIRRFEGTWRVSGSRKNQTGSFTQTATFIIRNGTADFIAERTATLAPGKKWSDFPAPYNSISPIYQKWVNKATDFKSEGSNIRVGFQGGRLVDWAPKTIPIGLFKNVIGPPTSSLCILSGQQLIATNGKQSTTYARIR